MINQFKNVLETKFKQFINEVAIGDDIVVIKLQSKEFSIPKIELEKYFESVESDLNNDETLIKFNNNYEVLIEMDSYLRIKEEKMAYVNAEKGIEYYFGEPSIEYLLVFLVKLQKFDRRVLNRIISVHTSHSFQRFKDESDSFYDFLRFILRRVKTIRIYSNENLSDIKLKSLLDGFTFNISFNTGIAITQVRYMSEIFVEIRKRLRSRKLDEIEAPKREYISDLVYHYQMGLSTHQPALKFTSFYHVLEHFFSEVFNAKIINDIRTELTSPKFSSKRNSDITKIIKRIKNNLKIELDENVGKSEKEALKLTLKEYISIDTLIEILCEYDISQLDYYKNNEVQFSNGDKVNLLLPDQEKVIEVLANRIYKTRNAIVHSKAEETNRYVPFKHELQLISEIPLIQILAEEVIINTSKIL